MDIKDRMKINRHKMPEQEPGKRIKNFEEVPFGYTPELAVEEAKRCIKCKKPFCVEGCPVEVDIPGFVALIEEGKFLEAVWKLKETNSLPAICGRVCPQESQCEKTCVLGKKGEPVAIGRLERFIADYERTKGEMKIPEIKASNGKKVAVVGSGPAGLTLSGDLVKKGYDVTIFEALHKAGGVLVYGIPEFRLPKAIVQAEIDYLAKLGVKIKLNQVIGMIETVDDLLERGFHSVFIATGAGAPMFMNIPGENLNGIFSANEFLTRSNLMKAYKFPEADTPIYVGENVAVIGGGNVAMDSARTAIRLGAKNTYIIYRRSRDEMPARTEEVHHGEEEGLKFHLLTNPVKYHGDANGNLTKIECQKMELGEPDSSGRRRPVPIKNSEFTLDVNTAIVAIGNGANPIVPRSTKDLKTNKWGNIEASIETGETNRPGIYAGGDIVTGAATVIEAMGIGKRSARSIDKFLMNK